MAGRACGVRPLGCGQVVAGVYAQRSPVGVGTGRRVSDRVVGVSLAGGDGRGVSSSEGDGCGAGRGVRVGSTGAALFDGTGSPEPDPAVDSVARWRLPSFAAPIRGHVETKR